MSFRRRKSQHIILVRGGLPNVTDWLHIMPPISPIPCFCARLICVHGRDVTQYQGVSSIQRWHVTVAAAELSGPGASDPLSQVGEQPQTSLHLSHPFPHSAVRDLPYPYHFSLPYPHFPLSSDTFPSFLSLPVSFLGTIESGAQPKLNLVHFKLK